MIAWCRRSVAWLAALAAPAAVISFGACSAFSEATTEQGEAGADGPPGSSNDGAAGDAAAKPSAYRTLVMMDSPLAYWRMGAAPDRVISDETGRGNHLVIQGGAHSFTLGVPGAIAGDDDPAIHFDGAEGFAQALDGKAFDFPADSGFTIEAWVRTVDTPNGFPFQQVVSETEDIGGDRHGFSLFVTPKMTDAGKMPNVAFDFNPNDGGALQSAGNAVTPAKWTHVAGVATGSAVTVYVDGTAGTTKQVKGALGLSSATLFVGASREPDNEFSGDIDEVAIYDKALSLDRIAAHSSVPRR